MGYDFMYLQLKRPIKDYPFKPDREFDLFEEVEKLPNVEALVKYLQNYEGFKPNGSNKNGVVWYWLDTSDGGSLDLQLSPDRLAINVDTHSHWKYVLEVLEHLQQYLGGLLVIDKQSMLIYDKNSFNYFIKERYSVK